MVKMSSGENIISYVETVTGNPQLLKFYFPMVLVLENQGKDHQYQIRYRSWLLFSEDKTVCEVDRKQVLTLSDPNPDIAFEYDEMVSKIEKETGVSMNDQLTEEDELLMDIEDLCYEVDMEKILNSKWGDPKMQNRGTTMDGISTPSPTEIRNVVDFLLDCGIISEMRKGCDMGENHTQDPNDHNWGHDPGDEDQLGNDTDTMKKKKWNPHDRWSE